MGKRIIVQRRGRGTQVYRARSKAFKYRLEYPKRIDGQAKIIKLFHSSAHTAPVAKVKLEKEIFYIPAFDGMIEKQNITLGGKEITEGNIIKLKNIPVNTKIYCLESRPNDGGTFVKTAGSFAEVNRKVGKDVFVLMPSKKEKKFNPDCKAIIGVIAGDQRLEKPIIKAGKKHYIKKAKNKLWPRTSALKMNAIDHPFGSGRGKVPKSKIAKRNAPPGAKVGLLRPKRTGKRK